MGVNCSTDRFVCYTTQEAEPSIVVPHCERPDFCPPLSISGAKKKQQLQQKLPASPYIVQHSSSIGDGEENNPSQAPGANANAKSTAKTAAQPVPNGKPALPNPASSLSIPEKQSTITELKAQEPCDHELIKKLSPYQPDCLRQQVLVDAKDRRQIEGAVAFVDISGFSALANTLGQSAKGAMILSQCINDFLSLLIGVVYEHNGDIVTFAGDAFIALWQNTPSCTRRAPLLHATQCSLMLQQKYGTYNVPGTNVVLRIHIGIEYGFFTGLTVTSKKKRSLFILTGRPLITISDAVEAANAGQVCLSASAGQLIADYGQMEKLDSGVVLVKKITVEPLPVYDQPFLEEWVVSEHKTLESYLPKVLLEHLRGLSDGAETGMALQRFVSVLFLGQPDLLYSDSKKVQEFAVGALTIVVQNGGEVLQVLQDDKGLHMVAVFGVHPTEQPGTVAVRSATEMIASNAVNGNKRVRIGIATGKVFCGIVGSEQRKAFDILGDSVNLSCRLMQLCSDTNLPFLCDEATQTNCGGKFMFRKMPQQYKMKGQAMKLTVYSVEGNQEYENLGLDMLRRRLQVHSTAVCGRHQERALLDNCIRDILRRKDLENNTTTNAAGARISRTASNIAGSSNGPTASTNPSARTDVKSPLSQPLSVTAGSMWVSDVDDDFEEFDKGGANGEWPRSSTSESQFLGVRNTGKKQQRPLSSSPSATFSVDVSKQLKKPFFRVFAHQARDAAAGRGGGAGGGAGGAGNDTSRTDLTDRMLGAGPLSELPMIVFEGNMGTGKSTLAVFLQNQYPLLPILVANAIKHDRKPFTVFQRVFSSLLAWIRLYSAACNMTVTAGTQDEDIIRQLLPNSDPGKLTLLDAVLHTHFGQLGVPPSTSLESGLSRMTMGDGAPQDGGAPPPDVPMISTEGPPDTFRSDAQPDQPDGSGSQRPGSAKQQFKKLVHNFINLPTLGSSRSNNGSVSASGFSEIRTRSISNLLFDLLVNFSVRVPALIIIYDDIHNMDMDSQDLVERLHSWAVETRAAFVQIVFIETGCIGILPHGASRHELRDLLPQDVREFLRHAFGEKIVESDIIPDTLCHLIGRKASYNAMMMAELAKMIAEPRILDHVKSNARAVVQIAPKALSEILDFDFSSSHMITQMVAHEFDALDAPQQIVAKAAAVVLAHPEARLYRPQLYALCKEFTPTVVDQHLDWLIAHRIMVVDTAGQPIVDTWRTMTRYKFAIECFGSVMTSLMSPDTLVDMNKRLAEMLEKLNVYVTAVNYDILGHYYLNGESHNEAARILMEAIELYADDDSFESPDTFSQANIFRAVVLRNTVATMIGNSRKATAAAQSNRTYLTGRQQQTGRQTMRNSPHHGTAGPNSGQSGFFQATLVDPDLAEKISIQLAKISPKLDAHLASPRHKAGGKGEGATLELSGVVDLDASARRLVVLLNRVEEFCESRKQLNVTLWQQFLLILQGYQRIQGAVAVTAQQALGSAISINLRTDEIAKLVCSIEAEEVHAERLQQLRTLSAALSTSIHSAANAAKGVLAQPLELSDFDWQDAYLVHIDMVDHQHKQLFIILKRFAEVVGSKDLANRNAELGKVFKWLLEYVLFHFLAEETLMRKAGYPQFNQHQIVHQTFTNQCLNLQAQFSENTLNVDGSLTSGLRQWLVVHIGNSDHHFSDYYFSLSDVSVDISAPPDLNDAGSK